MGEFRMPSLGADMTEGTILEWRVKPGDAVRRGDIVAVIDTAKAEIDAEIFEDGVIDTLIVQEGTKVPVGTVLATVAADGAAPLQPEYRPPAAVAPPEVAPAAPAPIRSTRVRVSPVARRMAEQLGVDLSTLEGTGPHGSICKADVERAAAEPSGAAPGAPAPPPSAAAAPPPPPPSAAAAPPPTAPAPTPAAVPHRGADERRAAMRETIAALMARSKREIPHYYLATEIDMTAAQAWMEAHNREVPIAQRMVPAALLLAATARAAQEFPDMNGFYVDGSFRPSDAVHLGVVIALRGGGLMAPAILDAARKGPVEIMRDMGDLVRRTRGGGLRGSEISAATLTVTSLGDQGVTSVFGVIYPPQVALVGFGRVRERPWAANGMLGARPLTVATLAADHRVSDGNRGALFLATIDRLLQQPEEL
jgi:pyruvate dehydrogenase E2 component (dihydrolipoamide acetyltransferase)